MFNLPDLPYAYDSLAPVLSADTLHFHHDKHHAAYVKKTNALAEKAGIAALSLEAVVAEARTRGDTALFNNAAQAWNHAFFWRSMTPDRVAPSDGLRDVIDRAFGGLNPLGEAFVKEGAAHFGSGWVWLAAADGGLKLFTTHDADDTLARPGLTPLIVCDLWEHAYYLDYKNDREGYLKRWFAELADWSFAERQLAAARGAGKGFVFPLAA